MTVADFHQAVSSELKMDGRRLFAVKYTSIPVKLISYHGNNNNYLLCCFS